MSKTKRNVTDILIRKIKVMSEIKYANSFDEEVKDIYDIAYCNTHSNRIENRKSKLENEFFKFPSANHEDWKYWHNIT